MPVLLYRELCPVLELSPKQKQRAWRVEQREAGEPREESRAWGAESRDGAGAEAAPKAEPGAERRN